MNRYSVTGQSWYLQTLYHLPNCSLLSHCLVCLFEQAGHNMLYTSSSVCACFLWQLMMLSSLSACLRATLFNSERQGLYVSICYMDSQYVLDETHVGLAVPQWPSSLLVTWSCSSDSDLQSHGTLHLMTAALSIACLQLNIDLLNLATFLLLEKWSSWLMSLSLSLVWSKIGHRCRLTLFCTYVLLSAYFFAHFCPFIWFCVLGMEGRDNMFLVLPTLLLSGNRIMYMMSPACLQDIRCCQSNCLKCTTNPS